MYAPRENLKNFVKDLVSSNSDYIKDGTLDLKWMIEKDILHPPYLIKFAILLFDLEGRDLAIFCNLEKKAHEDFTDVIMGMSSVDDANNRDEFYDILAKTFSALSSVLCTYYMEKMQKLIDDEVEFMEANPEAEEI